MEARGEVRGGRFIAGLSGEQFALPEAIGLLRGIRRKPEEGEMVAVCGADPLNLVGAIVAGEKVPALTGSRILYRDGAPIATLVSGTFSALEPMDAAMEWKAKGFLLRGGECEPTAAQAEAQRPQ
jgi:ATP-dependent Lhr-like helicase